MESDSSTRFTLFPALRSSLREGYGAAQLRSDILAGVTVGIVALPLAMALSIASGAPPQNGLYTVIIAGAIIALFGGARLSVSGPTAAFVVILAPVSAQYGLGGLLMATVMAGAILMFMGLSGMGRLVQYIPHPVTTGFTTGIAVVIASLQIKDFFGLSVAHAADHLPERMIGLLEAAPTFRPIDAAIGAATLAILIWRQSRPKPLPGPLLAVVAATLLAVALDHWGGWHAETIGDRFSFIGAAGEVRRGIPSLPPLPAWPWTFHGPGVESAPLTFDLVKALIGPATVIALLGAIESLLCAVVADGMAGTKHDSNAELFAQGLGNFIAPFFGGIPATAAIARTAANVRAGGRTPLSTVFHALFVLAAMLALAPLLSYLPMATLAALLLMVAWNMSDLAHFGHILKVAPKSDVTVLLTCFGLTVVFDMVIAVTVGIVLAALLFMKRMADIASATLLDEGHPARHPDLPSDVLVYEIAGPLFFGAAEKAMGAIASTARPKRVVIFDLTHVPAMDVTGLVALESAITKLNSRGTMVALAGLNQQPQRVLERGGLEPEQYWIEIFPTLQDAVEWCQSLAG